MKRILFFLFPLLLVGAVEATSLDELSGSLLAELEQSTYGITRSGAMVDRLAGLEVDLVGGQQKGATLTRLYDLRALIFGPGPQALTYKLSVLEWHVLEQQSVLPLTRRLSALEAAFLGESQLGTGSIQERINNLLSAAFGKAELSTAQSLLRQWTPIDVELLTTIDSGSVSPGQLADYKVKRDVISEGRLLIPAGTAGQGKIVKVSRAGYYGKAGNVEINFGTIQALDGTKVSLAPRKTLWNKDEQYLRLAIGLSMGGMLITGKVSGAALGFLVRGNQIFIPQGTELALEVTEPVELVGLIIN